MENIKFDQISNKSLAQYIQLYETNPKLLSEGFKNPMIYKKSAEVLSTRIAQMTLDELKELSKELQNFPRAHELIESIKLTAQIMYSRKDYCPELDLLLEKVK